ncbi:MAG: hypothetical protein LBV43_13085 [Prevotella sp.]|jgi:cell fate regulator YaaT (PSP1 superfamily)|nr:hypothetical protein [Prevotella sp.]
MDSTQNTSHPNDCQGTCKTPIGCTCANANKKALQEATSSPSLLKPMVTNNNNQSATVKTCCGKKGGCCNGTHKLEVYNWLEDLPEIPLDAEMVEVQFKNTRKGYFLNSNNLELYKGDIVAVEATPGHDIGEVTLTGKLVQLQMLKNNYRGETKRVYRHAKSNDIDKWNEARKKEHKTMLRAREIAEELDLGMKISDVEYQGDGNKAIFYYIADERVDFRQLIKVYASEFRVKIEMKQIGARQEAGRVGGIGPCGRELCCSSSMSNFVSVSTSAARLQDIPLNPQKLAGQCGKLKCCLNFEVDTYVEAQRKLPSRETVLETKDGNFYHFKTDILSGMMTYSTDRNFAANLVILPKERVYEVIEMNRKGSRPTHLSKEQVEQKEKTTSHDILQENINRFDNNESNNGNGRNNNRKKKFVKNKQDGSNNANGQVNKEVNKQENKPLQNNNEQQKPQQQQNTQGQNKNRNHKNRNHKNRGNRNGNNDQKKPEA